MPLKTVSQATRVKHAVGRTRQHTRDVERKKERKNTQKYGLMKRRKRIKRMTEVKKDKQMTMEWQKITFQIEKNQLRQAREDRGQQTCSERGSGLGSPRISAATGENQAQISLTDFPKTCEPKEKKQIYHQITQFKLTVW